MTARHALGEFGEAMAERHLAGKGMRIVDRRVRCRHGELDIVARDGKCWVFVEVKTRSGLGAGAAAEAFTPQKSRRMRQAVEEYALRRGIAEQPIRCDLVTVDFGYDDVPTIRHCPGAIVW